MPTWCHMFNSTLTGNARVWFDKLPKESIDSYEDLRTTFRENYLQQTKHIKDPVEIHHIKKRDGEFTKDFMERSMDEMYRMITSFLQGEVAALSHGQRKAPSSWKPSEGGNKPNFKKGFKNKQRPDHTGHNTDECMQLRKQIDEMIKAGKLSQFIKELKQNDKPKAPKKGEASGKDKPLTILMIQPWERVAKPRITQSFSLETAMSFLPLREEDGTEGPMIIEVEMGGHFVHRVYIDGGASSEVLYEHCFIKLRKEIRDQMVPATTNLIGFSGETIWPLGQIALLVKIGDEVHSTSAWMNFMSSRVIPMECAIISGPSIPSPAVNQPADMTGVPRSIAEHRLNIREGYSPVRQKKRGQAPERNKAIQEEVEKLVDAGIMKEVHYHSWLSNPVMVKKHDGTWRMCVDFKDLNNAYPKDCYPLPEID
ncbi:reverse transcriptase domain-containing protein [Tanacetum coccineum]